MALGLSGVSPDPGYDGPGAAHVWSQQLHLLGGEQGGERQTVGGDVSSEYRGVASIIEPSCCREHYVLACSMSLLWAPDLGPVCLAATSGLLVGWPEGQYPQVFSVGWADFPEKVLCIYFSPFRLL